jgi:hypothetical protein
VKAPGKGHSAADRSLSVSLNDKGDDIVVNSFSGDDPIETKDWIRDKLGLPKWQPKKKANGGSGTSWTVLSEHVYRTADSQPYLLVKKCLDGHKKKQYPQYHWDGSQWLKGKSAGPKIPYRLPHLIAAQVSIPVYFCEGEKDADALAKLGFVATTASEGAAAAWDKAMTQHFAGRTVVILPDADAPGRRQPAQAVVVLTQAVALLVAPPRSSVTDMPGLKRVTVGVVGGETNQKIVSLLTRAYNVDRSNVPCAGRNPLSARKQESARHPLRHSSDRKVFIAGAGLVSAEGEDRPGAHPDRGSNCSYGGYPGGYYGGYAAGGYPGGYYGGYANRSYVTGRPTLIPRYYGGGYPGGSYGAYAAGGYPGGYYGGYANSSYVTGRPTLIPRYYGW